jgi:hypothetical protein
LPLTTCLITCSVAGVGGVTGCKHIGAMIVLLSVVTVPPNDAAMPSHVVFAPTVMPALSITIPTNVELAPSVVAHVGVQNTSQADAPPVTVTTELSTVVNAPLILKIYVQLPLSVMPAVPIDAAPDIQ